MTLQSWAIMGICFSDAPSGCKEYAMELIAQGLNCRRIMSVLRSKNSPEAIMDGLRALDDQQEFGHVNTQPPKGHKRCQKTLFPP